MYSKSQLFLLLFGTQEERSSLKRWIVKDMIWDPKQFSLATQTGRRPPYICEYLRPQLYVVHGISGVPARNFSKDIF